MSVGQNPQIIMAAACNSASRWADRYRTAGPSAAPGADPGPEPGRRLSGGPTSRIENTPAGIALSALVVVGATGGCDGPLIAAPAARGIAVARLKPGAIVIDAARRPTVDDAWTMRR